MTDGGAEYPDQYIKLMKKTMNDYPKRFEYFGIEYTSQSPVMTLISQELNGTNIISYNASQLTSAYIEIINRKID